MDSFLDDQMEQPINEINEAQFRDQEENKKENTQLSENQESSQLPFSLDVIIKPQAQEITGVKQVSSNTTLKQIGDDIKNLFLRIIGQNSYPSVEIKKNKLHITSFYVPFNSSFKYVAEITIDQTQQSISMCYWLCKDNGQAFCITSETQRILISKSLNQINQTFSSGFFSIDLQGSIQLKKSTLLSPLKFQEFINDFYESENHNEVLRNNGRNDNNNSKKRKNKLLEYIEINLLSQVKQLQVTTAVILYMCDELEGEYFDILQDQGIIGNYDGYQRLLNKQKDLFDLVYSNQLYQKSVNNIEIFRQPNREPEQTLSSKIFQEIQVEEVNTIVQTGSGGFGEIQMANVKYVGKIKVNHSDPNKKKDEKQVFQKIFAIKKNISPNKSKKDQADRNRVTHELDILKLLQDLEFPHIARYFYSLQEDYKEFLFIDYYQFKDLNSFSSNFSKTFSLHSKINFMLQFSLGLKFLNDRGFYHCDIKPSNLLIGRDYILKIADFGESFHSDAIEDKFYCNWDQHFKDINEAHLQSFWREKHKLKPTEKQMNDSENKLKFKPARTIPFCPPECIGDKLKISFQSDIFSLGVMLSDVLFDTYPFSYLKSRQELLERQFMNQSWEAFLPEEYVVQEKGPKVVVQVLLHLALSCLKPSLLLPKSKQDSASEGNYILDRPSIDKIIEVLSLCKDYLSAHYSLPIPQLL